MISGAFSFESWLRTYNEDLNDVAVKMLYSLVTDAKQLSERQTKMKPLRDRAARLGYTTVGQMIQVCDSEFHTCYTCKIRDRYFKPCEKCKTVYFCSLQCQAKCAKKHRKWCKKALKRITTKTSPLNK